jgi:uncharacterized protein (DUF2141 family)
MERGIRRRTVMALATCAWVGSSVALLAWPVAGEEPERGSLTVVVVDLEGDEGQVVVALLDSAEAYEGETVAFRDATSKISDGRASTTFEDVPHGVYALKIFHDENGNGKLDTNFMGLPKEHFGFSNNAMGRFGPPKFEQAKFVFDSPHMTMEIKAVDL